MIEIKVGVRSRSSHYSDGTTPAAMDHDTRTDRTEIWLLYSKEWLLAEALDIEDEYAIQVLTHETIEFCIGKANRWKKMESRLLHLSDVCALVGF